MPRRPLATLFAATLLLAPALFAPSLGCSGGDLVETTVPSEGIELRYDLQAGATFDGHVRRRETISNRGTPVTRSISFTVQLVVNGVDESGSAQVAATVSNIDLNWAMPTMNIPISMNEFNAQAKAKLEGVTIRFSVDPMGKVFDVPPAPPELDQASVSVLDSVIEGLTSAFFVVPDKRLSLGAGWENSDTRGREGKLGKYTTDLVRGSLAGTFEHRETKQQLAKLKIEGDKTETTTTKDGSSEIRTRSEITVLFDTQASYMASIDSSMTRSQGATTTTVQFDADWTRSIPGKTAELSEEPEPAPAADDDDKQVQAINDPCDDNYVGPDDCTDPCNVNYMGDEACAEPAEGADPPAEGGDAPAEGGDAPAG